MYYYRINLRELLESAGHHICSVEICIRWNIHELLTWASLLRLNWTRVVISTSESSVCCHWISNRCKIGSRRCISSSSETSRCLIFVIARDWRHSWLYELHILEMKIWRLLIVSRLNEWAHKWYVLNDVARTIRSAWSDSVGCSCSWCARRLAGLGSSSRFGIESQSWAIDRTCWDGVGRCRSTHNAVGTVDEIIELEN